MHDFADIYVFLIIQRAQWFQAPLRPPICIYVSIMGQFSFSGNLPFDSWGISENEFGDLRLFRFPPSDAY